MAQLDLEPIKERAAAHSRSPRPLGVILATARDVPPLIAEVERLQAENQELRVGHSRRRPEAR